MAVFELLKARFPDSAVSASSMRRNVLLEGVDLNTLIGREFELQGIRFSGSQEAAPCYWMDRTVGEGAEEFLARRGGLRARILSDGTLTAGRTEFAVLGQA